MFAIRYPYPSSFCGVRFIQKFERVTRGYVKEGRGGEISYFLDLSVNISKMAADTAKDTIDD